MVQKLLRIGAWLIVVLIILSIGGAIYSHLVQASLRKTGDTFVAAVVAGDTTKTFNLLSKNAQKQNPVNSAWGDLIPRLGKVFTGHAPVYNNKVVVGKDTILTYIISGSDGNKYALTLGMIRQGTGWRVDSFTSNLSN